MKNIYIVLLCTFCLISCKDKITETENPKEDIPSPIFSLLSASETNIHFQNNLMENDSINYFTYGYIYMGGGVAAGDINNDGLIDLYFTGNQVANKLFLNKGNLQFEDITLSAGVAGDKRWFTGVTMADIDGDGFLDIYCSVGGKYKPKENILFHNNGNSTFTEQAEDFGIANSGNSVQSTFFDYDRDGDLDLYVANYPPTPFTTPINRYKFKMQNPQDLDTDRLYRNDGGKTFTDITDQAGVRSFGLTLSVTASDLNDDGWIDLYVSNDFATPDYLYLNQKDGTFKEQLKEATANTSFYGMGVDIVDYNNDSFLDIFQVDMSPVDNRRSKINMASMNPYIFKEVVSSGFHYQNMQNSLQLNTGVQERGIPKFQNISRLAGIASTDWSWAPLFADFDNDGWKDLFVANGTRKEINNRDYFNKLNKSKYKKDSLLYRSSKIPSEKIDNFVFKNQRDLTFKKMNESWGIEYEGFTNGSIYVDLDNDGDLELVLNNIDDEAVIFENTSSESNTYLDIAFSGNDLNRNGLGAKVTVSTSDGNTQYQELTLSRGFQSSVAPRLHFGLDKASEVEELKVTWPNGQQQYLSNVKANQLLTLQQKDATAATQTIQKEIKEKYFTTSRDSVLSKFIHQENIFDDYEREILLPYETSKLGPALEVGDLNGDGLDDIFIGGAMGFPATVYFQQEGSFVEVELSALLKDKKYEDIGASFFDADGDGDNDLYVVSGGNEFENNSELLQDRLYINNGNGNFSRDYQALPTMITSGSKAYPFDFDKDGDMDIFVGGRLIPGNYPIPADSYLLENQSSGGSVTFTDVTNNIAPQLKKLGLVTAATWTDYDKDGWTDLIIVGEWMPITVFKNDKGTFEDSTELLELSDSAGWWYSIAATDYDRDGDMDFVVGNLGLNMKYQASKEQTFDIYLKDFDKNTRNDIVLSYYNEGKKYPVRGRECSSQQIPSIKKKFSDYNSFSTATLEDIYGKKDLSKALHYEVGSFASILLENEGERFIRHELPLEAQMSSLNQILISDFDKDGLDDIVAAGNLHATEVETPRNDAGIGVFLRGEENGTFQNIPAKHSGLFLSGDVKDVKIITINNKKYLIGVKNSDTLQLVKILK